MASRAVTLMVSMALLAPMQCPFQPSLLDSEKDAMHQALSVVRETSRKRPVRVGEWVLYPDGYGLRVPDGMLLMQPGRGQAVNIVSVSKSSRVRANISLAVYDEDTQLHRITQKDVEGAAKLKGFTRVSMVTFERIWYQGEECVRYAYLTGRSPRTFIETYMFNRGGRLYVLTLNVEYDLIQMESALRQFGVFRDSFFFAE